MYGEFQHSLDTKGRVNFPAKLRESLGVSFFITKGLDNCIYVYSQAEWARLAEQINALPMFQSRDLQRFFFAGASEVTPDKQGRILIAQHLRDYAGLDKDIVIIGTMTKAEIWDKTKWEELSSNISSGISEITAKLGI